MSVSPNGTNVYAKVVELSKGFMLVDHCGKVYRIDFERYPYFRGCLLDELYDVRASAEGLHWPSADIDLEVAYIDNPPSNASVVDFDWWKANREKILSRLDMIGRAVASERRPGASRRNSANKANPPRGKTALAKAPKGGKAAARGL